MRDSLAPFAVLLLIVLFFLPAVYIGPLYFVLVVIYLLSLYAIERLCSSKTVIKIVDMSLFLVVMGLIARNMGYSPPEGLALGLFLLALEAARNSISRRNSKKSSQRH